MNFMEKLERKYSKYAVYGLHKYLVGAYCIGLILNIFSIDISTYMGFSMELILRGQIWRLVTWIFCASSGDILSLIFIYCVFNMAHSFEYMVGTFRMNVYLIGGMLWNVIGGILVYVITYFIMGEGISISLTNYYVLFTIFMALALCMPEGVVHLNFLFPIKMKWMFLIYILGLLYELFVYYNFGSAYGVLTGILFMVIYGSQIIFALLNLFLFFHLSRIRVSRKQRQRQKEFRAQMASEPRPGSGITRHKCAVCGRTELDDPNLTFRYCSKCTGNKEYCQEHLFTHIHE